MAAGTVPRERRCGCRDSVTRKEGGLQEQYHEKGKLACRGNVTRKVKGGLQEEYHEKGGWAEGTVS